MLFGLPRTSTPTNCSVCKRSSDQVNVWWPSPVKESDTDYVKKVAKCEYCMFGLPYIQPIELGVK